MIVELDFGFGSAGVLAMAFHFEMFAFVALAFELRIVELILFIQPSQWIVESSSDRRDFVASFGVRIRPLEASRQVSPFGLVSSPLTG